MSDKPRLETVYLGQFSWERANAIAGELEAADIAWWHKQGGMFARAFLGEWGVRLFVDGARLEEARAIVARTPDPAQGGRRRCAPDPPED
ncbi:MAG: hypothetical protein HY775_12130 [Acidobacteria bacterium]|nr:hypothetical protein [Acidobacteriota bacterium]